MKSTLYGNLSGSTLSAKAKTIFSAKRYNFYLGDNYQNFHLGRHIFGYTVRNLVLRPRSKGLKRDLHRGSNMSAHVLLNLLNELGKRDNMRGLPSIYLIFSQRV